MLSAAVWPAAGMEKIAAGAQEDHALEIDFLQRREPHERVGDAGDPPCWSWRKYPRPSVELRPVHRPIAASRRAVP